MASTGGNFTIRPLADEHPRDGFSCDHPQITAYFRGQALADHKVYKVRVHVLTGADDGKPLGFYSLVVGALAPKELRGAIGRKFGRWKIPSVYLAAVAVQADACRQGIGTILMLDAFEKAAAIAAIAGLACMTLDAIDEDKARWYEKLQFQRFGTHEDGRIKMFIPLPTLLEALA